LTGRHLFNADSSILSDIGSISSCDLFFRILLVRDGLIGHSHDVSEDEGSENEPNGDKSNLEPRSILQGKRFRCRRSLQVLEHLE
tara:strand:+ start:105 stop:359 length:255 start_codon:yes stop_codon:yes gene_type:complete